MKVRDVVRPWPPSQWAGAYRGAESLSPDLPNATITGARARDRDVILSIQSGGRDFSTTLDRIEGADAARVAEVLDGAEGQSLDAAGKFDL